MNVNFTCLPTLNFLIVSMIVIVWLIGIYAICDYILSLIIEHQQQNYKYIPKRSLSSDNLQRYTCDRQYTHVIIPNDLQESFRKFDYIEATNYR